MAECECGCGQEAKPGRRFIRWHNFPRANTIEDVLKQILICKPTALPTGCWEWQGRRQQGGYGLTGFQGRNQPVHCVMYQHFIGLIPAGMEVDHLCRNRRCCRPDHLEAVTHRENLLRGDTFAARHAQLTHCPRGHEYDAANTRVYKGMRLCRACRRVDPAARKPVGRPSRLRPGDAEAIRAAYASGARQQELATRYGFSRCFISMIINHKESVKGEQGR
jgi:hypothetical protein